MKQAWSVEDLMYDKNNIFSLGMSWAIQSGEDIT